MNERIRAREVRLIDENGVQLGLIPVREALRIARERELDLIEVAPSAQPPVCRIMDYGKHKYLQAKREREAHKHSKGTEVRLLRFKPQIGQHDLAIKLRKLRELLAEGSKVRINLRFRGRELSHPEMGTQLLNRIAEELSDIAVPESAPRFEGRMMNMMLAPKPGVRPAAPARPKAPPAGKPREEVPREAVPVAAQVPAAPAPAAQPSRTEEKAPDAQKQVEQRQVEPRREAADAEDSGEAG